MRGTALILAAGLWASLGVLASSPGQQVALIEVDGAIGPATAHYIERAIDHAGQSGAACLVIRLNTPGGLLDSTQQIVQALLASPVPTVVYVAPSGAGATSAGCFITLAADVAAMAPATNIGAAHPVVIGGGGGGAEAPQDPVMNQKLENYAISYIESIASRRERNVEWAISSVRDSASITAGKALELGVIEIIASDMADLLGQLDGRRVQGKELRTAGAKVVEIPMTLAERVFQMLWRPEVMFLLMMIAVYGIIGELSNPGAIVPGVVGVIALILMLYMAAVLPVNIAGLALIGLAVALFVAELLTPTYGVLTVGGLVAFVLGSLMLFDRAEPIYRLSLGLVIPVAVLTAAFFLLVVGAGLRAQRLPVAVGAEAMIGQPTNAVTSIDAQGGKVFVEGEYWRAVSDEPIEAGRPVQIVAREGLTLKVKPLEV